MKKNARLYITLLLCLIFIFTESPSPIEKLTYINTGEEGFSLLKTFAFLSIQICFFICLISTPLAMKKIKWAFFILFAFSTLLSEIYYKLSGWTIEYQDFLMLYRSKANLGDAISMYKNTLFLSLPRILILFGIFACMPQIAFKKQLKYFVISLSMLSLCALTLLTSITCSLRLNSITNKIPSTISLYGLYLSYLYGDLRNSTIYQYNLDKLNISDNVLGGGGYTHIILVIDESLRWDYSPFLRVKKLHGWNIYDYGQATSYTNFSAGSNIFLRKGVRFEKPIQDYYENPIIWIYAKHAGYSTYLYDNQHCARNHNFFSEKELKLIDHNICKIKQSDADIWNELHYLSKSKPTFTIIIKKGSHFPYTNNFPKNQRIDFEMNEYQKEKIMRIDYFKSVLYQSDNFIKNIERLNIKSKTLIIFTSDHGQNLEDKKGFTHGTSGKPPYQGEGLVPMVIITNSKDEQLQNHLAFNFGKTSHFNIIPTILESMGYAIHELGYIHKNTSLRKNVEKVNGFFYNVPLEDSYQSNPLFLELK